MSTARRLSERIVRRASAAHVEIPPQVVEQLAAYFLELARWNARINLTALSVDDGGNDHAVDRLLIEPVVAASHLQDATSLIDIGSGGGSPAIPMKIVRPSMALRMVESKVRKSVFLRQVARHLGLDDVSVENARFETLLTRTDLHEAADVLSLRAVRSAASVLNTLQAFVKPHGHIVVFTTGAPHTLVLPPPVLRRVAVHGLVGETQSVLDVLQKLDVGRGAAPAPA